MSGPSYAHAYKKTVDGIPFFSENRYWGKGSEEELAAALDVLAREGIEVFAERYRGRFDFTLDENRADWRFPVPLSKRSTVLDLGAGMGRISIPLARVAGKVVAVDQSFLRLKFLKARAEAEGLSVEAYVGDLFDLPFAEGSFDLIVMNGLLEWVGKTDRYKNPREAQLRALKLCKKMLKRGGYLYIGIENRWALAYLRGTDHSGLRFTSYMPRFAANLYTRMRRGEKYDTYTYGARGYRKLLREAGFGASELYLVHPGYNLPRITVPYDNLSMLAYVIRALMPSGGWKRRAVKLLAGIRPLLWLYRELFFSFNIFARK